MSKKNKAYRSFRAAIRKVWAEVPSIECKGLCVASCGPIDECVHPIEKELITLETGVAPNFARNPHEACPMLTSQGLCSIHENRPLICRMFGVASDPIMACPYGCKPKITVTNHEARGLYAKLQRIANCYGKKEVDT